MTLSPKSCASAATVGCGDTCRARRASRCCCAGAAIPAALVCVARQSTQIAPTFWLGAQLVGLFSSISCSATTLRMALCDRARAVEYSRRMGLRLFEVFALRDLKKCAPDGDDRGEEGTKRPKAVVKEMKGPWSFVIRQTHLTKPREYSASHSSGLELTEARHDFKALAPIIAVSAICGTTLRSNRFGNTATALAHAVFAICEPVRLRVAEAGGRGARGLHTRASMARSGVIC